MIIVFGYYFKRKFYILLPKNDYINILNTTYFNLSSLLSIFFPSEFFSYTSLHLKLSRYSIIIPVTKLLHIQVPFYSSTTPFQQQSAQELSHMQQQSLLSPRFWGSLMICFLKIAKEKIINFTKSLSLYQGWWNIYICPHGEGEANKWLKCWETLLQGKCTPALPSLCIERLLPLFVTNIKSWSVLGAHIFDRKC